MSLTIQKPLPPKPSILTLRDLPHREVFYKKGETNLLIKVKTVNFINNSTIIVDMLHKRNCLVVSLASGTCFIMDGGTEVEVKEVTLAVAEEVEEPLIEKRKRTRKTKASSQGELL